MVGVDPYLGRIKTMTQDESIKITQKGYDHYLLNLIPPDAVLVIEMGCAEGQLGARYKRRNPGGRYIGVEAETQAAATAKQALDQVVNTDPGSMSLQDAGFTNADCIITYGHLLSDTEPWNDFQRLSATISDRGVLLASFENAEHWSHVGKFFLEPPEPHGNDPFSTNANQTYALDVIQNIFKRAGLRVLEIIGVGGVGEEYQKFLHAAQGLLKLYGTDKDAFTRRSAPGKFIVRATKKAPEKHLFIQSKILAPIAACNDKRIHEPASFLRAIPGVRAVSRENNLRIAKVTADEPRLFLWQRPIMIRPDSVNRLKQLLRAGYLVIVEFDDDPRRWQDIVDNDYLTFRGVHAVQTSTDRLADFLRQFNPNVAVFPNQMVELPERKNKPDDGVVRLFFGALNREDDWRTLISALNNILQEFNQTLHVTVVHDRIFFDALETQNKIFHPLCDYTQYLQLLSDCDIGLLPLESTEFNQYKSDLKFIEFAAYGVVALASHCVYGSSIKEGETGMLFHNENEFEKKLRLLITNTDTQTKIANAAYRWVAENRLLGMHYRDRYNWYQQLLEKLPALNQELQQRMPELFAE
jgi:glycosyltransferase involved in cell wall biosynthesis